MSPALYQPIFLYSILLLCIITATRYLSSSDYTLQEKQGPHIVWVVFLGVVYSLWLGGRPASRFFGDTGAYMLGYANLDASFVEIDWSAEWIFQWIGVACKNMQLETSDYLTVIYFLYVFSAIWAVKRFMPLNPMLGMLFVWASLSYFTYGVNGIRNGLACHVILLAYSYLLDGKLPIGVLLSLIAFGIHRSTILPIAAIVAAIYFVRDPKQGLFFWLASIVVSLVAGDTMINFFASLGFDDRMSSYGTTDDMTGFSGSGFRWDFLLYSAMPILLGWYVCIERQIKDNWYNAIFIAYCLSNAFWVMVIDAQYSNRFAYLSWFMYPIVIAYPLINMPVWEDQDKKTGLILLAYIGFTMFMNIVYWGK